MVTYLCSFCGDTLYRPAVNELHQQDRQCCHQYLGDHKCEPYCIDRTDFRQYDSRSQHDNKLYNRSQQCFSAVAECLKEKAPSISVSPENGNTKLTIRKATLPISSTSPCALNSASSVFLQFIAVYPFAVYLLIICVCMQVPAARKAVNLRIKCCRTSENSMISVN